MGAAIEKAKPAAAAAAPAKAAPAPAADDEDDDVDLFGSESDEEEDAEAAKVREERLAAYAAKNPRNPPLSPKPQSCSIANLGTMKPIWTSCSRKLRKLKWTDFCGVLANLFPLDTVSANSR